MSKFSVVLALCGLLVGGSVFATVYDKNKKQSEKDSFLNAFNFDYEYTVAHYKEYSEYIPNDINTPAREIEYHVYKDLVDNSYYDFESQYSFDDNGNKLVLNENVIERNDGYNRYTTYFLDENRNVELVSDTFYSPSSIRSFENKMKYYTNFVRYERFNVVANENNEVTFECKISNKQFMTVTFENGYQMKEMIIGEVVEDKKIVNQEWMFEVNTGEKINFAKLLGKK